MVEYFHQKIMFVSHPDMKLPIYQALTGFKHKSQYVIPYNHKYTLEKIDQRK
jgi:1-deoxy-D-xylulose 5-phosphate reductoisomerase